MSSEDKYLPQIIIYYFAAMFSIGKKEEKGWVAYTLTDEAGGFAATVIPQCGGILHEFGILLNGTFFNIIENYEDNVDFGTNAESKGFRSCKLSPFVCRLKNGEYAFEDKKYKVDSYYLPPHAIHGIIYKNEFVVKDIIFSGVKASVILLHEYKATDAGYPFYFDCEVIYTLQSEGRLSIHTKIINRTKGSIPIADGWHPYFSLGGTINDWQLQLNVKELVEFDDTLIPTGKLHPYNSFQSTEKIKDTFFDNCFTANETNPVCTLYNAANHLQLEIISIKNYPYLQVYTPPDRKSIAIENLSSAPDAFNNNMGLTVLKEGEEKEFEVMYRLKTFS